MTPEEKISEAFHPKNTMSDICTEMADDITLKIAELDTQLVDLSKQRDELADRRAMLDYFKTYPNLKKVKLLEEIITEKLRREQVSDFTIAPGRVVVQSEVDFKPTIPNKPSMGIILKDALERGMDGSAFDPAFDPAPLAETHVEERAPFERVDVGSLDDERPTDEQVEEAEAEESPDVAFYREGAEDERMGAHPGDKKAASVSAILGKTKARDRGKLWRKIVQSAGETGIAQFNRYTVATALCFSNRTLNDALEGFVAQGNIEMLEHDDESWVKMRILRR